MEARATATTSNGGPTHPAYAGEKSDDDDDDDDDDDVPCLFFSGFGNVEIVEICVLFALGSRVVCEAETGSFLCCQMRAGRWLPDGKNACEGARTQRARAEHHPPRLPVPQQEYDQFSIVDYRVPAMIYRAGDKTKDKQDIQQRSLRVSQSS